jgi:8-oxo-dGTP diphosphatase
MAAMASATGAVWRMKQFVLFELGALPYAVLTAQPTWRAHGARLAELAGVKPGDRVLDLGCGPGESAFGMAERVPGLRVTGLDYSDTMIRIARARQRRDPSAAAVELTQGNAMDVPFADATFDAVTGHSFLYLVPDAARVVGEARRVLKPGGRCVFLEPAAVADRPLLPRAIRAQTIRDPRFVSSMALWRLVSRRYGRFDDARFARLFEAAGLRVVSVEPTLEGLGFFGIGERPSIRSLSDVAWDRWAPTDRATLLFVVEEDRVLLIRKKRGLGAGKINAPGGRIEPGESATAAAVRECQEELHITPTGVEEVGELSFQFADGYALHARVFRASGLEGTPTETDEAIPLWTPLDRIPFAEMWADDALWIPKMLARERFRGRFVFDGERMLDHALDAG